MTKVIYYLCFIVLIYGCKTKAELNHTAPSDPIPEHDNFSMDSKHVNELRVINVWTPPSYVDGTSRFPVLYMPDGGIKEDFPHIANTISKLVESKQIPPIILVGIENTERRRDLTGFSETKDDEQYCPLTDGAKNFRNFIFKELKPEIEKKYRTTDQSGIIGESLAGLFVVETYMISPGTFDFYIAMDPSLWWNDHYLVRKADSLFGAMPNEDARLWFAGSSAEDISEYTNELEGVLKTSAPDKLTWKYSDEPGEKHHTIFRATKEKALIWTLSGNK